MFLAPAAQGADIFNLLKSLPVKEMVGSLPSLPTGLSLPKDPDGISTSFDHAYPANTLMDGFEPSPSEKRETAFEADGLKLTTGFFDLKLESYCLQAGTYQPKPQGSGYLMAPLEGPKADIIKRILINSASAPDIPQSQIQALIWGVLSNARLNRMPAQYNETARRLLSAQDIYALNGGLTGLIPDSVMRMALDKANKNVPEAYRNIVQAYDNLKSKLESGVSTFEELERIAVLNGEPTGGGNVKPGQWALRPGGYFIRALPSGYSKTRVQIYRPLAPTLVRNNAGTLTEVDFNDGYKIKTEYDAKQFTYRDAQTGQAITYAVIKNITLSSAAGTKQIALKSPVLVPSAAGMRKQGFTLSLPAFKLFSEAHATTTSRGEHAARGGKDLQWYKETAERTQETVERVKRQMEELERAGQPVSKADEERFLDEKFWLDGIEAALSGNLVDKSEWFTNYMARLTRMYAWTICRLNGQCEAGDSHSQNPLNMPLSDVTAVPANTRQQRLGMSARTYQ